MATESPRSRPARKAAEEALVRVVHHYGETPEFVVLGGLVPELLCDKSRATHAGTTDIDVQVDLEIAAGATNAKRLERALSNAEFESTDGRTWRWQTFAEETRAIVKFELLTDLDDQPANATVNFAECDALGAVNLRGTRFASRDYVPHPLRSKVGEVFYDVEVNVAGVAGFLLSKAAAAHGRHKEKDWYDIAFVLLHSNVGGPREAAERTRTTFSADLVGETRTALDELMLNFTRESDQGPSAYASQFLIDHPAEDVNQLRADAVLAVGLFHQVLFSS
jgi:hypothetical protein